ncbi:sensor histidine kinase [Vallitaleaceae bacterium 9-2]
MIQKIKEYYINKSIQSKMMMNILLILAIAVVVLSYLNMNVLNRSLTSMNNEQTLELADQVNLRIENYIQEISKKMDLFVEEPTIKAFGQEQMDEEAILETLERYTTTDKNIAGILVVDTQGEMLSNTMKRLEESPLNMETWYIQTVAQPETIHLFSQQIGRNITSFYDSYKADNILSMTKALINDQGDVTGIVLFDMKLDYMESVINSAELGKSGFLYISNRKGEVVYAPVNPIVYRIHPTMIGDEKDVQINGESYQIIAQETGISDWNIVGVLPKDETLSIILEVITSFVTYAVLIFLFGIVLSIYLTKTLTRPISKLKNLMAEAEQGKLEVHYDSIYNDEISQLGHSFNKMIEAIKNLLSLVYSEQKAKREAELKAFQAQIKPHFLYNTLDTINWMAMEYEADDIVEVVESLTNLFRISLSKGNEIISLENEVKHVNSYLTIQKVRYEEQFDYEIICEDNLKNYKVIKLIIQPLVENAIYHGIKGRKESGHIRIHIYTDNKDLYIVVADTGGGMAPEQVQHMNQIFEGILEKDDSYGIGLFNVNERIKLNFGMEYGLSIDSALDEGTTVTIKHPIQY